jgi:hypothetical protein
MARAPLPIGTWGKIRVYPYHHDAKGKPDTFRAETLYRDFDGRTRTVTAYGRSRTLATNKLRERLKERSETGRRGELTAMHRFSAAADLWMEKLRGMVAEGRRAPGTVDTYERQLRNHVLPALGEVRLAEASTPLVDKVVGAIKSDVSPATAKPCASG